jgi:hypothetical protein
MDDPALEDEPETTDADVWAEIERMRDDFYATYGGDMRAAEEDGRRIGDELGMISIDSDDHPLHPRNVMRRQAEKARGG